MIVDQRSSNTIKMMKTLAVMMATLLAGGCASVQSRAGWASQYKDCLAKAQRAAAEVNEMEEVVSEVDEDVLALCLDSGHGRAVSSALVTVAKVVGVIILVPFMVVLCVLDPVGCVKGLVGLFAR